MSVFRAISTSMPAYRSPKAFMAVMLRQKSSSRTEGANESSSNSLALLFKVKISYGTVTATHHYIIDFIPCRQHASHNSHLPAFLLPSILQGQPPHRMTSSANVAISFRFVSLQIRFALQTRPPFPGHRRISHPFIPAMIIPDSHNPTGPGAITGFQKSSPLLPAKYGDQIIKCAKRIRKQRSCFQAGPGQFPLSIHFIRRTKNCSRFIQKCTLSDLSVSASRDNRLLYSSQSKLYFRKSASRNTGGSSFTTVSRQSGRTADNSS